MVRFARSEGSKGSNKRVLEEPTPWLDMMPSQILKKKKVTAETSEKKNNIKETGIRRTVECQITRPKVLSHHKAHRSTKTNSMKKEEKKRVLDEGDMDVTSEIPDKKTKLEAEEKTSENALTQVEGESHSNENTVNAEETKQKKKRRKKKASDEIQEEKKEYVINDKGLRVKVHKDGTERTWFDLPYTENDYMTRYDNMWVKKEMVKQLDELKQSLKQESIEPNQIMKKMMKAKRKAHRELRIELIYEQKRAVENELGTSKKKETAKKVPAKKKKNENEIALNKKQSSEDEGKGSSNGNDSVITGAKCNKHDHQSADVSQAKDTPDNHKQESGDFKYKQQGHQIEDCPSEKDVLRNKEHERGDSKITCFKCKQQGHRIVDCPSGRDDYGNQEQGKGDSKITCFKCNQQGHRIADCPSGRDMYGNQEQGRGDSKITCFKCNQQGHRAADCPSGRDMYGSQEQGRGDSKITCFKCNQQGHRAADCPSGRDMYGSQEQGRGDSKITCFKCNQQGHRIADCPSGRDMYDSQEQGRGDSKITCFKCNQQGHRIADCPSGRDRYSSQEQGRGDSKITCFKCNQQGHRMAECSSRYNHSQYGENRNQFNSHITCFQCNQQGHRAIDCQARNDSAGLKSSQQQQRINKLPQSAAPVFEENDFMTKFDGYWVKKSEVAYLEEIKKTKLQKIIEARVNGDTSNELTESETITLQRAMKKVKKIKHELMIKELRENKTSFPRNGSKNEWSYKEVNQDIAETNSEQDVVEFDGYWVYKKSAARLHKLQAQLIQDGVSEEEQKAIILKERRKEEKVLKNDRSSVCLKCCQPGHVVTACPDLTVGAASSSQSKNSNEVPRKKIDNGFGSWENKTSDADVQKFDGFWVRKDSADRLHKLRARLRREGVSESDLKVIMQQERRKEERFLKNEKKLVCLKCREAGHMMAACPLLKETAGAGQTDICYTCGSTEHRYTECPVKKKGAEFSHATCFVCGEVGHIARECSDNPRGLYPRGGACRECGSVEHLRKDCPEIQKQNEKSTLTVGRMNVNFLEALDDTETQLTGNAKNKKSVKIVTF